MAFGSKIPPAETLEATADHVTGWLPSLSSPHHWRQEQSDECQPFDALTSAWSRGSSTQEGQWEALAPHPHLREALNLRTHLEALFRARQDIDTLPGVWRRLSEISRRQDAQDRLQRQQEKLIQQLQERLARLEQRQHEREREESPPEPDDQQRWMMEHPDEVEKHRGRHIAVHATRGIIAVANDYASLVEQLEQQAVPDDEVVIEFIRPSPFSK